jgi:arylsulfatase A-like enzyme
MPEALAERTGGPAPTQRVTLDSAERTIAAWLAKRELPPTVYGFELGAMFVDRAALERGRVKESALVDEAMKAVRATPGVLRVDRLADLARADTARDVVARRWRHMIPPDYPVPLVVTLKPGNVWGDRLAGEHGTPSDEDARVPLVLWGAPFRAGLHAGRVSVVDLAPTLAAVLGTPPTERVDGRVLREALAKGGR